MKYITDRKSHCCHCNKDINPGDDMIVLTQAHSKFNAYYLCFECVAILEALLIEIRK